MTLQLADRFLKYPYGVAEDVLVKVDKFIFPVDFVVMDIEEDIEVPLILGRPFMKTAKVIIDVDDGKLKVRVQDDEVNFNVFEGMQHTKDKQQCFKVDVIDETFLSARKQVTKANPLKEALAGVHDDEAAGEKRKLQLQEYEEMRLSAYESSEIYKGKMKAYHDKKILKREFYPGQSVLLFNSRLRLFPGKLKSKWSRPFLVKTVKPYGAIELEDPESKRSWVVNGQRLKPYFGGEIDRLTTIIQLDEP